MTNGPRTVGRTHTPLGGHERLTVLPVLRDRRTPGTFEPIGRDDDMSRTRGITVREFDARRVPGDDTDRPTYGYAYVMGPDGTEYVICTEGVGWVVDDTHPLVVDTWTGTYSLSVDDVRDRAISGTDRDLADWVRSFGSRLESNFHMWARTLRNGSDR